MSNKKKEVILSDIPSIITAKVGYKALVSVGKQTFRVTSKDVFKLRPTFTEEALNSSTSLRASLDSGWVIPYTDDITLTKEPDLGFKIPDLKPQNSFVTEVHFSVNNDTEKPVITMGESNVMYSGPSKVKEEVFSKEYIEPEVNKHGVMVSNKENIKSVESKAINGGKVINGNNKGKAIKSGNIKHRGKQSVDANDVLRGEAVPEMPEFKLQGLEAAQAAAKRMADDRKSVVA